MNTPARDAPDTDALDALLGPGGGRTRWWHRPGVWIGAVLLAVAAAGAWWWLGQRQAASAPQYQTQPVARGALTVTVTASGTLQPIRQVAIGSELSGTVARVHVDVNDRVKKGQVLVELDDARLRDQVAASRAALAAAEAALAQARATAAEARDTLARLRDVSQRSGGLVPSAAELDAAQAAAARAEANVASARAGVEQARATLSSNETNLRKASIRSPIDGVVLSRAVEPGNAVAASLQAVTLFTLAEDLKQMKLQVNVDEADVGQVREGQAASFTVSSYPNRRYPAKVLRVGYGSTVKDNVVTYLTDLSVDNDDLSLRPGMTATATITTTERTDVLLVPNAALRYSPQAAAAAPRAGGGSSFVSSMMPRPPGAGQPPRRAGTNIAQVRQVWVLEGGQPRAVPVKPGASDGRQTEVTSDELQPGMAVIVGQTTGAAR
ncbi:efflux RND transporter periplasmic adaptor subunit [Calidifontimicrobium sp. SYSU G02091]|uniref:efflux RND transporter periplasmic adaptor subunit n=1 Tax=Calidifontimicrobium sp. SYSU G02091 TaxID=2926421 RepID=UPI001F53E2D6|nr:efflux RND transporter periplasmic adaptor subunit [Calidifontimicrobium sp. SYSU G02091]MCI1190256.1 efflux RND transporter periplasmic adaptor subunit [Calidifontimicrobium sp. SYSU G02091]